MDISISLTLPTRHNNDDDTKMRKYGEKITEKGILHTHIHTQTVVIEWKKIQWLGHLRSSIRKAV